PKIVGEMVKPAEKIKSINVNHVSGLGQSGDGGARTPVNTAMDSIMEMAVQLPLLKKIGDQMGVSFDEAVEPAKKPEK
ncbi:MAG: flotillin domain-containing protein, partial [Pseudomonadota bacterium]